MRVRQLDAHRPMPLYILERLSGDAASNLNPALLQVPTGIEKAEEHEFHLVEARTAQRSNKHEATSRPIPTPNIQCIDDAHYRQLYPTPTQQFVLIHQRNQLTLDIGMEPPVVEYDADASDLQWLAGSQAIGIGPMDDKQSEGVDRFERYMEMFEQSVTRDSLQASATILQSPTSSPLRAMAVPDASEIRRVIVQRESDACSIALYDYWLDKRHRCHRPLTPRVKSEQQQCADAATTPAAAAYDPYVAFRRRAERVQTRKHRRNDRQSYACMLRQHEEHEQMRQLVERMRARERIKLDIATLHVDQHRQLVEMHRTGYEEVDVDELAAKIAITEQEKTAAAHDDSAADENDIAQLLRRRSADAVAPAALTDASDSFGWSTRSRVDNGVDGEFTFRRQAGSDYQQAKAVDSADEEEADLHNAFYPTRVRLYDTRSDRYEYCFLRARLARNGCLALERIESEFDEALERQLSECLARVGHNKLPNQPIS